MSQRGIGMKLLVRHPMPACHILSPTTPPCSVVSLFHSSSIPFQFHFTLSIPATCLDPVRRVRGLGETVVRVPTLRSCVVIPQRTQCYQLHPVSLSLPLHVTVPALPHQLSCLLVYSHWLTTAWTQQTGGARSPLLTRSGVWSPSIHRQVEAHPGCTVVIVVKVIQHQPCHSYGHGNIPAS